VTARSATALAPPDLEGSPRRHCPAVSPEHHVGVKHREQSLEVTLASRREERVGHLTLAAQVCFRNRRRTLQPAAGPARELTSRCRRALDDWSDLGEGHSEHVVQDEREPLGGIERLEHHHQRETHRVGQQRLLLGVAPIRDTHNRIGDMDTERLLTTSLTGCSWLRHTRATTVVSHPPRFSMFFPSERLSRSQTSWTASSASFIDPSIR
jgi:hypothetical protein